MTIADNIKTNEHINGVTQNTATCTVREQDLVAPRLKPSLQKFYRRLHGLVARY